MKKPLTVICGSDGAPWMMADDPRSVSDVAGWFRRPPKLRLNENQAWLIVLCADDPRVADVDVVLPPLELLVGPGQVAGARPHRVRAGGQEVAAGETVGRVELVIDLQQDLVGVVRAGHVALPDVAGNVGRRNVRVDDLHRHRIEPVGADRRR